MLRAVTKLLRVANPDWTEVERYIRERQFRFEYELPIFLRELIETPLLQIADRTKRLGIAQCIMYEAWEQPDSRERERLSTIATLVSSECADAFSELASLSEDQAARLKFSELAVAAGERALGGKPQEARWGHLECRPYLRAKAGLAASLWDSGRHADAIAEYRDILRLNPGDNQGIRCVLLSRLGQLARFDEMDELVSHYPHDALADTAFTRALLAYRRKTADADALLGAALARNRFVPDYLSGRKRVPKHLSGRIAMGSPDEAKAYAAEFASIWRQVEGALDWLASFRAQRKTQSAIAEGPPWRH